MIRSLASARASSAAIAAVVSSGYPMAIRSAMVAPLVVAGRPSQSNPRARRAPHPSGVSAGHPPWRGDLSPGGSRGRTSRPSGCERGAAMTDTTALRAANPARAMILPLALAQFIASYAATNMNVAISAIATDLGTDVAGVQTAITLFTLTMAALMIPGSKLTDIWGRKRCFILGLAVYGAGGLLAALSPGLALLIVGYSLLEGIGSALLIPPIYILVTVAFPDIKSRAAWARRPGR